MYLIELKSNIEPILYYNISTGGYTKYSKFATKIQNKGLANIIKDVITLTTKAEHIVVEEI